MKRLFVWLAVLAVLGIGLPARAENVGKSQVQGPDGLWRDSCDAMAGESVACRSVVTVPRSGDWVYTCRLSRGLLFEAVTGVMRSGERLNAAYYTVVTSRREDAAFTLHISPLAASPGDTLSVEYTLFLNDEAEGENFFSVALAGESGESGCIRTFSLTAMRAVIVPETGQPNPVAGACLCLSYDPAGRDRVAFRQRGEDQYLACTAEGCQHARHLYVMKTPRSGRVYLDGLPAGTYYLCETRPADGMGAQAESVELTISPEGVLHTNGTLCPDATVMLTHSVGEEPTEERRFSLTEFYRRGSELLTLALLALVAARRYYI